MITEVVVHLLLMKSLGGERQGADIYSMVQVEGESHSLAPNNHLL